MRALVEDCPLLFEAGLDAACDATLFVDADRERRRGRDREQRGWDDDDLRRREAAQMPLDMKRERADYSVTNDGDPDACFEQVARLLLRITKNDD